ncbi:hypothetical protein REB14_21140 [Chryseobacterium sp. ES2]|uniref:Lipoprotein n=1 Tax=Chryseobacterium metallicongregator TaxID=3073042 RepID=A0ABU1EA91_9FLAO|nr:MULTISPECIES: hypothetical protein [Chryseobacterium]MDR4954693.1 hypothetical protein [Chryseobacterium sp. ES2]
MNAIIKGVLSVVFVLVFWGCSIPTDFYIQNLTETKKTVKINYKKRMVKELSEGSYGAFSFNYENDIVQPKFFRKTKNLKSLEKKMDSSGVMLEINPHSTVRIEKTHNFMWKWYIVDVEIDGQKYSIDEIAKKSENVKDDYIFKIE